ncbi:MAG: hypothetical protein E7317_05595 [Clostridiales bacterium]|nr:hypothetical protein [Clostridiales bacterium]
MYPFCQEQATLLRLRRAADAQGVVRDLYVPEALRRCAFRRITADGRTAGQVYARPICSAVIPADQTPPSLGDMLLPGAHACDAPLKPAEAAALCRATPCAFRVTRTEARTGAGWPLPHYVAMGESIE